MCTDVSPHRFSPYRWYDRFWSNGRCKHCLLPQEAHPVHCWMTARPLMHGRYYTMEEVFDERLSREPNA